MQVFAPDHVARLAKLKKAEIASESERLAAGSGWLPLMFRTPDAAVTEAQTEPLAEAVGVAEVDEVEDATAKA